MADHHLQVQQQQEMSGGLDQPPGFRFHPTDEEIITFYLTPKVLDTAFCSTAIGEVDLNKSEPWDLPSKAKMGEKEWYFYRHKDRKYPTGMRTNRATEAGYWKATGKDKEIYRPRRQQLLVGMKKTLVFYKEGSRGDKTNWIMHEYRLEGSSLHLLYPINSTINNNTSASSKDEWVVCRIFHKSSGIKKVPSYHMAMLGGGGGINDQTSIPMPTPMGGSGAFPVESATCTLPPLMDPSSLYATTAGVISSSVAPPASSSYLAADPSLAGVELHMNGQYLGNPTAAAQAQPMFYQQIMGAAGGFMTGPASGPSSMVSQDTELSNEQNNAAVAEISSVNRGMDGMWRY